MDPVPTQQNDLSVFLRTDETLSPLPAGGVATTKTFNPLTPSTFSPLPVFKVQEPKSVVSTKILTLGDVSFNHDSGELGDSPAFFPLNKLVSQKLKPKFEKDPTIEFEFVKKIGKGNSGSAVLIRQPDFEDPIIIKMLTIQPGSMPDDDLVGEVEELGEISKKVLEIGMSPNFNVPYYGAMVRRTPFLDSKFSDLLPAKGPFPASNSLPIVALEFADSGTLFSTDVIPTAKNTRSVVAQLLFGLDAMNRVGILHRDISPVNVALTKSRLKNGPFSFVMQAEGADGNRSGKLTFFQDHFEDLVPVFIDFGLSENDGRHIGQDMFFNREPSNLQFQVTALFSRAPELVFDYEKNQLPEKRNRLAFHPKYGQDSETFSLGISLLTWLIGHSPILQILHTFVLNGKEEELKSTLSTLRREVSKQCLLDVQNTAKWKKQGRTRQKSAFHIFICDSDDPRHYARYLLGLILLNGVPPDSVLRHTGTGILSPIGQALKDSMPSIRKLLKGQEDILESGLLRKVARDRKFPKEWESLLTHGRTPANFQYGVLPIIIAMMDWDRKKRTLPKDLLMKNDYFSSIRSKTEPKNTVFYGELVAKRNMEIKKLQAEADELGKREHNTTTSQEKRKSTVTIQTRVESEKKPRLVENGKRIDIGASLQSVALQGLGGLNIVA